jgi:GST-like protein
VYLGRKTGKFYPKEARARVEVEQWLYWQMANPAPTAARPAISATTQENQVCHRYTNEGEPLYGVMDARSMTGPISRATTRSPTWLSVGAALQRQGQDLAEFPNLRKVPAPA